MAQTDLQQYLDRLKAESVAEPYVARRFGASTNEGGAAPELGLQFRGVLRESEPDLAELLKHSQVVLLGEPGAGKSQIARAVVRTLIEGGERVPVFIELRQYRAGGALPELLKHSAPPSVLELKGSVAGELLSRTYVFDGMDEIPADELAAFVKDLEALLEADKGSRVFLTARQAFYVANRESLPQYPAVFHILDFSDEDIREYIGKAEADDEAFIRAAEQIDALDEIRNPFVLSVMLQRFCQTGKLSELRSDNLSFIIDRLIQSRPFVNQHKQRRALCMLAIAMETYCRNELTEHQALQVIRQAMLITEASAKELLLELYGSILRRTPNGLVFQMRSYGEYLAAEALENDSTDELKATRFC
jgi:hypothetical protein